MTAPPPALTSPKSISILQGQGLPLPFLPILLLKSSNKEGRGEPYPYTQPL